MRFRRLPLLIHLTALILLAAAVANSGTAAECQRVLDFAEHLRREGDYYRAIGEYKRLLFECPAESLQRDAAVGIAESYFLAGRYREADDWSRSRPAREVGGIQLPLLAGHSLFRMHDFDGASAALGSIADTCGPGLECSQANYLAAVSLIRLERGQAARPYLLAVDEASPYRDRARRYAAALTEASSYPTKRPVVAGALGVVPGLGYAYCEHYGTAVASLVVNGLLAWATIDAFDDGDDAAGFTFSIFAVGFYLGNIVGSVQSAHRYNAYQSELFQARFQE
jgi:hypothetical protein